MSAENYDCTRCGAAFGIAGGGDDWTDDDMAAQDHYETEVRFHEARECVRSSTKVKELVLDESPRVAAANVCAVLSNLLGSVSLWLHDDEA